MRVLGFFSKSLNLVFHFLIYTALQSRTAN